MSFFRQLLIGLMFVSLLGCDQNIEPLPKKKYQSTPPSHLVEIEVVTKTQIGKSYRFNGTLKYRQKVHIHNQEKGAILALEHFSGDRVNKGDTLVLLDDKTLKPELLKAQALAKQAVLTLKRLHILNQKKITSKEAIVQAQTNLEITKAEVQILKNRLSHTQIKAPFAGVITQRMKETGDVAAENTHLLTLANPDSLIIEAQVSEKLLAQIRLGQAVDIHISVLGEDTFKGQVSRIFPQLDQLTHYGTIEITLSPMILNARAGYSAKIILMMDKAERILVPSHAIRREQLKEIVYLVKNDIVHRQVVVTGDLFGNTQEIKQGLEVDQKIIVKGFLGLSDKKQISVKK